MTRYINVAIGQLGPVNRNHNRASVVARLMKLMREAHTLGADLIVYPELALTTFFPRWYIEDEQELDAWFESSMPNADTQPLFELAGELNIGFYLGYAELVVEAGVKQRYNTAILVDKTGEIVGKYHKVHLPGHREHEPWRAFQHLEKRYFTPGDDFPVYAAFGGVMGMALCNDRRWCETYRVMALNGVEMVLIGYNTPVHNAPAPEHDDLSLFHNQLSMQAGAYQNGTWVVGVAKAGNEEGVEHIGGSCIIAPSGEVVARCVTKGDEVAIAHCDLDFCQRYKRTTFDFDAHRQPRAYQPIVTLKGETLAADGTPRP
ncbi:putative amidohydrolase|uniref:Putative amidohydrolase n=2 Tax=Brenneria salicis TaxID=55214 RepID=A0A366I5Z2_9GAMM|nr:N-carbamoyl-D-amino-acid hydrolase [Brenneria salicis]NMN90227.1 putative amidohydrolase [Brenneria salicis ATCC 15712 = DSM 30166]RBP62149.1 putative amidohydrolase [Brenneria salicis ATCC 15712 = DSM 30166]RLM31188.1 N-carbamoyl-D-amino-acid hydrolase [Brenneria salicis ATCC 15712 = DSM 30166]